jgi:hypothetical protein
MLSNHVPTPGRAGKDIPSIFADLDTRRENTGTSAFP